MAIKTIRNSNDINKKIIFVADLFRNQLLGGGECNDDVLINYLNSCGHTVELKKCPDLHPSDFKSNNVFIVGNFITLSEENKKLLREEKYIIYEHDHKYVKSRDPSVYKDFLAPPEQIINQSFYENAIAVVVLSEICQEVMKKNLNIGNIYNIGCSLWTDAKLDFIESLTGQEKNTKFAVLNSQNPIKNTSEAVQFCKKNKIDFDLIDPCDERELLSKLSHYKALVFFPKVLETFSRVSAEVKMLNCGLVTKPNMLGFASEPIYKLSGKELIKEIRKRKDNALKLFIRLIEGD